ncbi:major facilitator superfamily transporter [Pyricularia oryzae Y34]|uniref:Major facilitator superfamily transporter n=2 Tax=Pyricularia oryzae TaxID=318829 RepID=A0AA97PKM3_PYRO3|nr:major facilitator superfamily transporter [Pyricularia oryzae Y34]KAI7910163.1 major facilitator superfamily transporter [Pyricularia oryzae]
MAYQAVPLTPYGEGISSAHTIAASSSANSYTAAKQEMDQQYCGADCRCKETGVECRMVPDRLTSPALSTADSGYHDSFFDARERNSEDGPSTAVAASGGPDDKREKNDDEGRVSAGTTAHEDYATREDGAPYITGLKLFLVMTALCLSVFLMALDSAIIAVAIPKITDEFNSLGDVGWYGSAYLLTVSALQLFFGKLYTFYSIKLIYFTAIGLFELGSLICGAAKSSLILILGRAIAGIGSAGLFSGSLIILAHSVPMARRPLFTGILGSMYGIAVVAGPLLGGVFTDKATWRWCFYINLPFGAISVLAIAFWFREPRRSAAPGRQEQEQQQLKTGECCPWRTRIKQFDPAGTVVFMPAVVSLLLALQWAGTEYAWSDARIIALLAIFGVLAAVWLGLQWWQDEHATMPPRIIKKRTVWAACIYAFAGGGAFISSSYFIPIWFQAVQGVSAVESGIRILPFLLALVVASLFAGAVVTIWGYYAPFLWISTVVMSVGFGLLSTWNPRTKQPIWIGYQVVAGAGVGFGMQQPVIAVQTVLDIEDVPMGTSVIVFVQSLGGAIFVSIAESIFVNKLVAYLQTVFPGMDPKLIFTAGATELRKSVPRDLLARVIRGYSDALTRTLLMSAVLAAASVFGSLAIEWRSVKGRHITAAVA